MRYQAPEAATKFWVIQNMRGVKTGIFAFTNEADADKCAAEYARQFPMHGYTVQLGL